MTQKSLISKKATVLALGCLFMLGGCSGLGTAQHSAADKIYFSHSLGKPGNASQGEPQAGATPTANSASAGLPELVIYFDNDSSSLRPDDLERLQSFVMMFADGPMPVLLITGHTDSNHTDLYNIKLSERRAKSTQVQLLRMGVPITQTALRSLGESTPIATNENSQGRQYNRRVSIRAVL